MAYNVSCIPANYNVVINGECEFNFFGVDALNNDLSEYIASIANDRRKEDAITLLDLIGEASGYHPYLTGNMIGFGTYHYQYESGHEGDSFVVGFAPRKQNLAIYIIPGFSNYGSFMEKLGKHKVGKSCLYINKLADVDQKVLRQLIKRSVEDMQKKYECKST